MNVAIDIGNTRIKIAAFENGVLVEKVNIAKQAEDELKAFLRNKKTARVILASSGYVSDNLENYLCQHYFYLRLKTQTPTPILNLYRTPQTFGKDRIAAIVGATSLFADKNCIIVDAGTCITYEVVNHHGIYLGGNISPGISMRLQAMDEFTAALPLVEKKIPETDKGYSTESAMRNGAVWGAVLEIEGFIQRFAQQIENPKIILTGGDASLLQKMLHMEAIVCEDLVLIGLNKILDYNAAA